MADKKTVKMWMRQGESEPVEKEFADPSQDAMELNALMVQGFRPCGSPAEEQGKPKKKG